MQTRNKRWNFHAFTFMLFCSSFYSIHSWLKNGKSLVLRVCVQENPYSCCDCLLYASPFESETMKQGKAFCVNFWLFHVSGKLWINFHSSCGVFHLPFRLGYWFSVQLFRRCEKKRVGERNRVRTRTNEACEMKWKNTAKEKSMKIHATFLLFPVRYIS